MTNGAVDSRIGRFDDAVVVLRLDGQTVGHLRCSLGWFRPPFRSFTPQPWLWFAHHWDDGGDHVEETEDYGPDWYVVEEIERGTFECVSGAHKGSYEATLLTGEEAAQYRSR